MRNVMIDNPAGISRRIIFFIENGNRFLCYLSFSASAHGKKVAAAFAAVLHQPIIMSFMGVLCSNHSFTHSILYSLVITALSMSMGVKRVLS